MCSSYFLKGKNPRRELRQRFQNQVHLSRLPHPSSHPDLRVVATGEDELPPIMSVQQQQAEQMKVYWKVETLLCLPGCIV